MHRISKKVKMTKIFLIIALVVIMIVITINSSKVKITKIMSLHQKNCNNNK